MDTYKLVVVTAGTGDPSSTRMLADRTAQRVVEFAAKRGRQVSTRLIDLRELAGEVTTALVSPMVGPKLGKAIAALGEADGIVAATPVYKAAASGLFTSFFQTLDNDLLIAKPIVLAATAGREKQRQVGRRHARSVASAVTAELNARELEQLGAICWKLAREGK